MCSGSGPVAHLREMPSTASAPKRLQSFWPDTAEGILILVLGVLGIGLVLWGLFHGPLLPALFGLITTVAVLMAGVPHGLLEAGPARW